MRASVSLFAVNLRRLSSRWRPALLLSFFVADAAPAKGWSCLGQNPERRIRQ